MSRILNSCLLTFGFLIILSSCQKEYSEENGNVPGGGTTSGTAVFILDGAPSACTSPSISGTYAAGSAMGATNTVILTANVTTPGTYTITSGTANGVQFSGSGTFTATGLQFIQLTASGTATAAGTFNYTPGTNGCSFPITFTAGGGTSTGTAVYTYAGAPNACTTPAISGTYAAGTAVTAANTAQVTVNVTTPGTYSITTNTADGISFNGAGSFAATGANTITLTATGTPADAGTFNFTPGTNGCSFPITVTAGSGTSTGTAVFTYAGAPNACTTPTVNGTYTAGTAATSANTVQVSVNVTTPGTYNVTSTSANGISFSGTGSFAATGTNTITLTATGTPAAAGTFNYTPGTNGCSFPITVTGGTTPSIFLKCTINGVATEFNTDLSGLNDNSSSPQTLIIGGTISSATGDAQFNVGFIGFTSAITTGTYHNGTVTNLSKFVSFDYTDNAGVNYTDDGMTANALTAVLTTYTSTGASGTFSGTIKQDGSGPGSVTITNGSFAITY